MSSSGFQFKQFFIAHDQCAMKVNTDGILLGVLADVRHAKQILDLGTGSCLVAIMLAQRAPQAAITALEIEPNAYRQAVENAQNCAWAARIAVRQGDVMSVEFSQKMDLIVANPPYYAHSPANKNASRDLARIALQSHLDWLKRANDWLNPQGKISFILPFDAARQLLEKCTEIPLYCSDIWHISTKRNQAPKRAVITFQRTKKAINQRELIIYDSDNQYSEEYKILTQDFYLKG